MAKKALIWIGIIVVVIVGYTIYWILTDKPPPPRGRSGGPSFHKGGGHS